MMAMGVLLDALEYKCNLGRGQEVAHPIQQHTIFHNLMRIAIEQLWNQKFSLL
jgi:hypothetical protein